MASSDSFAACGLSGEQFCPGSGISWGAVLGMLWCSDSASLLGVVPPGFCRGRRMNGTSPPRSMQTLSPTCVGAGARPRESLTRNRHLPRVLEMKRSLCCVNTACGIGSGRPAASHPMLSGKVDLSSSRI